MQQKKEMAQWAFLLEKETIMQSHYYRLNKQLDANKIMHDISSMIQEHSKLNKLENTILHIEIKDISYTYDVENRRIKDDREKKV